MLTLMIITFPTLGAETPVIAIMSSQHAKPYQQIVAGFKTVSVLPPGPDQLVLVADILILSIPLVTQPSGVC